MNTKLPAALVMAATPVLGHAADLKVTVEIPRLDVAEYHRPYVAMWIATPDSTFVANLQVWYEVNHAKGEGATWLKDIRQWWRRSGRSLTVPIDGVTAPTRAPGEHTLNFPAGKGALASLAPGEYHLVVEASREVGGRELITVPFRWGGTAAAKAEAKGTSELGKVSVEIVPAK